jgi:hypothetical protein
MSNTICESCRQQLSLARVRSKDKICFSCEVVKHVVESTETMLNSRARKDTKIVLTYKIVETNE